MNFAHPRAIFTPKIELFTRNQSARSSNENTQNPEIRARIHRSLGI